MKKITLALALMFAYAITGISGNIQGSEFVQENLPKNIAPSTISCTSDYIPGATMDLAFEINISSPDDEYADLVTLNFPSDFTINSASATLGGYNLNPISGTTVSWGDNGNTGYGNIFPGIYTVTVNVSVATNLTGIQTVPWAISGDTYGGLPHSISGTLNINKSRHFVLQQNIINPTCSVNDGSISISIATGGVSPFTYLWNNNNTSSSINNLDIGFYQVSVTDSTGFTETAQIFLSNAGGPIDTIMLIQNPTCFGYTDGFANSIVLNTGGGPFTHQWSFGPSGDSLKNAPAGNYFVTITDQSNNCKTIKSISLTGSPSPMNVELFKTNNPCANSTNGGTAWVTATGGGSTYYYNWSNTTSTASNISGLGTGNFNVTVTDNFGCAVVKSDTIQSPASISYTSNVISPSCAGGNNGSITISISGGVAPYNLYWNNFPPGTTLTNLYAGTYYGTIYDANNCSSSVYITLTEPSPLNVYLTPNYSHCNIKDGSIDNLVNGGTPPYAFLWNDSTAQTTQNAGNLWPGTYQVTVTDYNNCTQTSQALINDIGGPVGTIIKTDITCFGKNNGIAKDSLAGGVTYTFHWSNGDNTETADSLSPGEYFVTVTDPIGCKAFSSVIITEPSALTVYLTKQNISCFNSGNIGAFWATPSGGTYPYSFSWDFSGNIINTSNDYISDLAEGSCVLTLTDYMGCTATALDTIFRPASQLGINPPVITTPVCAGVCSGSSTISATNGVAPYNYYTYGGPDYYPYYSYYNADLYSMCAGTYHVTVTDAYGCTDTVSYRINDPISMILNFNSQNPTCAYDSTGSIDLTVLNGNAPYNYQWSIGMSPNKLLNQPVLIDTTEDISHLWAEYYSVLVKDSIGCEASKGIWLYNPAAISLNVSGYKEICGDTLGTATVDAVYNNQGPVTYQWSTSPMDTLSYIDSLSVNRYFVTVTDSLHCKGSAEVFVNDITNWMSTVLSSPVNCFGESTGTAWLQVTNGVKSISDLVYNWSTTSTNDTIYNLPSGLYYVTITDTIDFCSIIHSVNVTQNDSISFSSDISNLNCFNDFSGSINLYNYTGGVPYQGGAKSMMDGYDFLWSNDSLHNNNTPGNSSLAAGIYSVTVSDALGCQKSKTFAVTEPPAIIIDSMILVHPKCFGNSDGAITAYISNTHGTVYYSDHTENYATDGGGGWLTRDVWDTSNTFQNRPSGSYTIKIKMDNQNETSCIETIGIYNLIDPPILVSDYSVSNISCYGANNGTITVHASGGTHPYSYRMEADSNITSQADSVFSGLSNRLYKLEVHDANNCSSFVGDIFIDQPTMLTTGSTTTPVSCFGGTNGQITNTTVGGTPPYQYNWSSGDITSSITTSAGIYYLTVTDSLGCIIKDTASIASPDSISLAATVTNISCNGMTDGSILISISGGTPNYISNWNDIPSTFDRFNLSAGIYTDSIIDANGCRLIRSFTINEPTAIVVSAQSENITCNGLTDGSININASGGTGILTYYLDLNNSNSTGIFTGLAQGTYSPFVKDDNLCSVNTNTVTIGNPTPVTLISQSQTNVSCNGGTDGTIAVSASGGTGTIHYILDGGTPMISGDFANLSVGTYSVIVIDSLACQLSLSFDITEPATFTLNSTTNNITCFGSNNGSAIVIINGGTSPYTFNGILFASGDTILNLISGQHNVIITDSHNCTAYDTLNITEPTQLTSSFTITDVLCNGNATGKASVLTSGGTSPYTYLWSNSLGTDSVISNVLAGTYSLTITDAQNCSEIKTVTLSEPSAIVVDSINLSNVTCNGDMDGSISIFAHGGLTPYTYSLLSGVSWLTNNIITNVDFGIYDPKVKDANGCIVHGNPATITQPDSLKISFAKTDVSCNGLNDASITISVLGGTQPYDFSIQTQYQTSGIFNSLAPAMYHPSVKDAHGCITLDSVIISEPQILNVNLTGTNLLCFGDSTGQITSSISGGTSPYLYSWSDLETTDIITNLYSGTYTLTVIDANNCTKTATATLTQPSQLILNSTFSDITCNGLNNGAITLLATGGTLNYSFSIDGGTSWQTSTLFANLISATYDPKVKDANNCYAFGNSITISEPLAIDFTAALLDVTCAGLSNGSATITTFGGTLPYLFNIGSGNQTSNIFNGLHQGTYFLTITDANNCNSTDSLIISEPAMLSGIATVTNVSCFGLCDGSISVDVTGGTLPYSYNWNNLATSDSLFNLCPDPYNVTVTDLNNCSITLNNLVTEPALLLLNSSSTVSDCRVCNASAAVTPTGGTLPYSYSWNNSVSDSVSVNLCAGIYKVTVADANNCIDSISINVTALAPSTIQGIAQISNGTIPDSVAVAELYKIISDTILESNVAYSIPVTNHSFLFGNIDDGDYILKISMENNTTLPYVFSTYFDTTIYWEKAHVFNINGCAISNNATVNMLERMPVTGNPIGQITGYIVKTNTHGSKGIYSYSGPKLAGEPIPGAEIYVELEPDDEPIANTQTDTAGYYSVSGLPEGHTYSVIVDIPGFPLITTSPNININSTTNIYTNINFVVDTSSTGGVYFNTIADTKNAAFSMQLYPNPYSESLSIDYKLSERSTVSLDIIDMQGKTVATLVKSKQESGDYSYKFRSEDYGHNAGTFLVRMMVNNTVILKKVIEVR